jgi:hypothetical protein
MRADDWISHLEIKENVNSQKDFYWENGMMVMTSHYHLKRGYCCKNGCCNCPY